MRPRALLVALAVLTAGCSGFGILGGADRATLTPAPVPSATETPEPQSPTERVLGRSLDELPATHGQAIRNRSYTLVQSYRREIDAPDRTSYRYRRKITWVQNDSTYRRDIRVKSVTGDRLRRAPYYNRTGVMDTVYRRSVYVTGDRKYVRSGGTRPVVEATDQSSGAFAVRVQQFLDQYLDIEVTTVEVLTRNGDRLGHVAGTGTLPRLSPALSFRTDVYVTQSGLVRLTVVRIRNEDRGRNLTAVYRLRYRNVGETTVPEPEWLEAVAGQEPAIRPNESGGMAAIRDRRGPNAAPYE